MLLQDTRPAMGRRSACHRRGLSEWRACLGAIRSGEPRYPWRYPVEPVVALEPTRGIPGSQVAEQLHFLSRLKQWGTFLQRSLNRVPDEDGERLLALLKEPREAVPIELPKHAQREAAAPPGTRARTP